MCHLLTDYFLPDALFIFEHLNFYNSNNSNSYKPQILARTYFD